MNERNFDAGEFGRRLDAELKERGIGILEFQKLVSRECGEARGSSYGTVWSYVRGEVNEPRPNIVRAMARVLSEWGAEVRPEYLLYGDTPRSEAEAAANAVALEALVHPAVSKAVLGRRWTEKLSEALEKELGGRILPVAHAVVAHHWRRLHELASNAKRTRVRPDETLRQLAKAVAAPFTELETDLSKLRDEERADYVMAATPAVSAAMYYHIRTQVTDQIESQMKDGDTDHEMREAD